MAMHSFFNKRTLRYFYTHGLFWVGVSWGIIACSENGASQELPSGLNEQLRMECLNFTNEKRATEKLTPLLRHEAQELCADQQAANDQAHSDPHGGFQDCDELAQNTCPGWPIDSTDASSIQVVQKCLQSMWDEGPGEDFSQHGHYLNMSSTRYTGLACGFSVLNGRLWVNMNFY